jgi:predicted aspartyl protease
MTDDRPDRRAVGLGLAGLALGSCAGPAAVKPPVLVDLAQARTPPLDGPAGDDGALLGTGADAAGRITVPVRVNGQGPFDFVVDTGANRTVVAAELAAALGLPDDGPADIHGIAGVEPARKVMVRLLEVDEVATRGLHAPTLPRSRMGADGLLGVDILKGRLVTLDFNRNQLRIGGSRGTGPRSAFEMRQAGTGQGDRDFGGPGVAVPARYRFGQLIIVDADVAGRPVTAFIDSGSQSTVGNGPLRRLVVGVDPDPKARRYVVALLSATGQSAQAEVAVMPPLRIGGLRINRLTAAFADLHVFDIWRLDAKPSLLIGVDVMSQFNAIQLDYGGRQVIFYPRQGGRRPPRRASSP